MVKRSIVFFILNLIIFPSLLTKLSATEPDEKIPYRIPKVNTAIKIDAHLNEAIWQKAVKIEANIEVQPGENIPAPVKTDVLMAYNNTHIFVAFKAYDPEPDKIRAHFCDRDQIWDDDWVLILFDSFNDQRRTYDFACNPFGIQSDMIETPVGGGDEWDAIWESDGRITDEGYIVEMSIPFASFGFPRTPGDQIWGFDAVRSYPRVVRHHIGAFPRDRNNNCYMCQAEKLIGFGGARPGKNIEFDPTLSTIITQEREDETSGPFMTADKKFEPGLTARWGVTPNLTVGTALNPDFSNVEADAMQLDINNQFAIYYSEKRPFFLEGADFFETPFRVVHTRTLADPDWGVKLTGKEGAHTIGFYTVQDRITNFLLPGAEGSDSEIIHKKSFGSVLRYKHDLMKSSSIGLMVTDREGDQYHNRLAGFDSDIKFTQKDRIQLQVLNAQTQYPQAIVDDYDQPASKFDGYAYYGKYSHETRSWEMYGKHMDVDRNFRSDLGFMSQADYKYTEIGGGYIWREAPGHWYNWFSIHASYDYRRDQDDNLLHKAWTANWNYEGPLQSHSHIYFETGKDRYDGQEFRKNWVEGCAGLRPVPEMFAHLYWRAGDAIDYSNTKAGTSYQLYPSLELNVGLHLKFEVDHNFERLFVDEGRLYTANISYLKVIYQFNKRMFFRTILQYKDYRRNTDLYIDDDVENHEKKLFSQILLSYKINPQTVFFLGYSDDYYGDYQTAFLQTNRTIFAKIGYAYML